ncbi:MAG: putative membrane protein [Verrucomicrobiales bacterium]|jgi:uncharacterized membrane protein
MRSSVSSSPTPHPENSVAKRAAEYAGKSGRNDKKLPIILLMFVVTLLAQGLALNADFYMDDFMHIVESETVIGEEWNPPHMFRMLPYVVYRAIYAIAGPSSFAFHCLNLILHFSIVLTIFAVGKRLFRRLHLLKNDDAREMAALVGALVFAAHPLCTEAVNYARCSMIQMVTLFSLLASYHVLCWLEKPNARSLTATILFTLFAVLSKDPGIFHVGINLALLCLVTADREWISKGKEWAKSMSLGARVISGLGVAAAAAWVVPKWVSIVSARVSLYGMEYVDHILTQGRMLWGYLGRMILPMNLHVDHHIAVSRSAGDDPLAVLATVAVVLLCGFVAFGLFRKRFRVASLLAALVLGHLVLRFAYPIYEHFVEYRAYPSLPWVGLIAGLLFGMLYSIKQKPAILTALAIIVLGCAFSSMRSAMWSDSGLIAANASEAYEFNNRPRCQLQVLAYQSGKFEESLQIADEIHAAYGKLIAFNQNNPQKREFDPNRALDDLLMCEQMKTYAIAELEGSKAGIQFATERIEHFSEHMSPGRRMKDREKEIERALESLFAARQILTDFGEEYDRKKQERQQMSAKSE